ncbi:hypothetical protein MPLSOD_20261 [Mesorhizobium sp. SOD10]|nr:hypothetical protein MPLSOD_20261 [Mesorhizobium sp. SOD10]
MRERMNVSPLSKPVAMPDRRAYGADASPDELLYTSVERGLDNATDHNRRATSFRQPSPRILHRRCCRLCDLYA